MAVVRVDPATLVVLEEQSVLVHPERLGDADPKALAVCGYSPAIWSRALPLKWALRAIAPLLDGALIAGHNVGFDWSFLDAGFRRAELPMPRVDYHRLDTASLAWLLKANDEIDSVSLDAVCAHFGIDRPRPHRALEDARCAHQVALRMLDRSQAGERLTSLPEDEREITDTLLDRLAEGRAQYGEWSVLDGRDYVSEAYEELLDGLHYIAAALVKRRRSEGTRARRIYVCHPFAGDPAANVERVRGISRQLAASGALPIAPHLYLPQFLDEAAEREEALRMCLELLGTCDEVRVFGTTISPGMRREIAHARAHGIPVHFESEVAS